MSLTSLLGSPSPVRDFFAEAFPNTRPIVAEVNDALDDAPLLGNPALSRGEASTVGTAFDYRARFYFRNYDPDKTVALGGTVILILSGRKGKLATSTFKLLSEAAMAHRVAKKRLPRDDEDRLNGICLGLAYFEQFYRADFDLERSPLGRALMTCGTAEEVVREVCGQPGMLEDMRTLSWAFHDRWIPRFAELVTLNPTFAGSGDVGGADADMIIGGTLVDLKTSRQRRPCDRQDLWQLAGYALLDYRGKRPISALALDFVRRDRTFSWPLDDLLAALANSRQPVSSWRNKFRNVTRNLSRATI